MSLTSAIPLSGTLPRSLLGGRAISRSETVLAWSVATIAALFLTAAVLFLTNGGRWFVVETPSMGEAAPVGTLVLDMPVQASSLRIGDIVSYQTPANPDVTYTHRIVAIDPDGGIHARGDVNGAEDPWTLTQENLVGAPVLLVPHLGWLFRAAPILLIGTLLIWALTSAFTDRITRGSLRIAGSALTVAYAAFLLKPFVNVTTISNTSAKGTVEATVVSSGMFPVRIDAVGGNTVHLVDGEVGRVTIHELSHHGQYQLMSNIDLDPMGWAALIAACLLPLLFCLAIGRVEAVRAA
ncbi:S26 family signal peptidase [Curtobacterium sp. APC 4022]|uniref:S26 family signal peptidase n=1 Tax=Curtobacterium sp. APC 4022 TaxID=3035201 RepID=UPI0025B526B0|nr:S26 family signal peptidase [Curtobacterium sp. APC 4022]MDN3477719.1 S26 family signal peptidase [Curtobacterium sp. APC 4022]